MVKAEAPRPCARKPRFKIPKPENLANVALFYLGRFAASEASLRRVLENRVRRAARAHPAFAADTAAQEKLRKAIEDIVAQHTRSGALNDEAFAAMKAKGLRRAGGSARRIAQKLQQKGVAKDHIAKALQPEDDASAEEAELKAALAFARRRRLGPFRASVQNGKIIDPAERRRKDFATMARAGYAFDVVRKALGGAAEDAEDMLY